MKVRVVRSRRRRKTVEARMVGDTLQVSIPAGFSDIEEAQWVSEMVGRIERRRERARARTSADLAQRAEQLAARYGLRTPASIRWVDNQNTRWGSCTPGDGSVRISTKLLGEPEWVLDYVIVHELAHLHVAGHGPDFWRLVERYPRSERARGFLLARAWTPGEDRGGPFIDLDGTPEPDVDGAGVPVLF